MVLQRFDENVTLEVKFRKIRQGTCFVPRATCAPGVPLLMHYYHMSPGCQQQAVEGHVRPRAPPPSSVSVWRVALHGPPVVLRDDGSRLPGSSRPWLRSHRACGTSHRNSQLFLKQLLMMTSLQVLLCDLKISPGIPSFLCTQNFKGSLKYPFSCVIIIQRF